jgi:hypothetical protein
MMAIGVDSTVPPTRNVIATVEGTGKVSLGHQTGFVLILV